MSECELPVELESGCETLIALFDELFSTTYNTRLVLGDADPVYLPADMHCDHHRVVFAHGFYNSALHEVAHWTLAGERRRQQIDYGYWYVADGRDLQQQRVFEAVEVKPQAVEWTFTQAAGRPFRVSCDNLAGIATNPEPFKKAVVAQVHEYCRNGLPPRADAFRRALASINCEPLELDVANFETGHL